MNMPTIFTAFSLRRTALGALSLLMALCLVGEASAASAPFEQVSIVATVPTAVEPGSLDDEPGSNGEFTITREGTSGNQTVYFYIDGQVLHAADYNSEYAFSANVTYVTAAPATVNIDGTIFNYCWVTIPAGSKTVAFNIVPLHNERVLGAQVVTLRLVPRDVVLAQIQDPIQYNPNGTVSGSVTISERDLTVRIQASVPVGTESEAVVHPLNDLDANRRAVERVQWSQRTRPGDAPSPANRVTCPDYLDKNVMVAFSGRSGGVSYKVEYKVCGSPCTVYKDARPLASSIVSIDTWETKFGDGMGFIIDQPYAYPSYRTYQTIDSGQAPTVTTASWPKAYTVIKLSGTDAKISVGNYLWIGALLEANGGEGYKIIGINSTTNEYTLDRPIASSLMNGDQVKFKTAAGAAGFINDGNTANGATPKDLAFSVTQPNNIMKNDIADGVNAVFGQYIEVAGGNGLFTVGDKITLEGLTGKYVVTRVVDSSRGTIGLFVRGYENTVHYGIEKDMNDANGTKAINVITTFEVTMSANQTSPILVPPESNRIEYALVPTDDAAVQGSSQVAMRLIDNTDYSIRGSQVDTVVLADDDASADIEKLTDATRPDSGGIFRVSIHDRNGNAVVFPAGVDVPISFAINSNGTPGDQNTGTSFDYYVLPGQTTATPSRGLIVLKAGQPYIDLTAVPRNPPLNPDSVAVTVTLDNSVDYQLVSSASGSIRPSATVNILNRVGVVGVVATTKTAQESATVSTNGAFTFTISRDSGQNGAIGVNFKIDVGEKLPSYGRDYTLLDTTTVATGVEIPVEVKADGVYGAITIPGSGATTATIQVKPLNNNIAEGDLKVNLAVIRGVGYGIDSNHPSDTVTIRDAQPSLSITADVATVTEGGTGTFTIAYDGEQITGDLPFSYTVSVDGPAVAGTNFTITGTAILHSGLQHFSRLTLVTTDNDTIDANSIVRVTLGTPLSSAYTLNAIKPTAAAITILDAGAPDSPGQDKPTPGDIVNDSSSGGGCGLGGGLAAILGAMLLAMRLALRPRR